MAGIIQAKLSREGTSKGGKAIYREHWTGGVEVVGRFYMSDAVSEALGAPAEITIVIATDAKAARDTASAASKAKPSSDSAA